MLEVHDSKLDTPKRDGAAVGDWLHYRYSFERWGIQQSTITTRRVTGLLKDGVGKLQAYTVEGDFRVEVKQVISVIPGFAIAPVDPLDPGQ